jgi:hypothetical protein
LKIFRLYGTSACHLCEMAQDLLATQRLSDNSFDVEVVDISETDVLVERYGVRIPVLQHPDERELNWPFAVPQLRDFLDS